MRIAIWWDQESWGGVDTHLLTLLRNWPSCDDRVVLFHNQTNQGAHRILQGLAGCSLAQSGQLSVVTFPELVKRLPNPLGKILRYFLFPLLIWIWKRKASCLLKSHGPFDALISDNGAYPGAWSCLGVLWSATAVRIPVRLLLVHHAAGRWRPLRHNVEALLDLAVQRWVTDLVAVSRATRLTLLERRGFNSEINPIRVVHNGVDPPNESEDACVDLREQLSIPDGKFVVGMVGRVERYKGHEDLMLALSLLPQPLQKQIAVVVVGGGEPAEQRRLESIARSIGVESQVKFAGYVKGNPCLLIRQFDLLASLTKDFEGFALTVAEAMWVGTPVLATAVGGVPEFVSSEIAVLIPPESPGDIAASLSYAYAHREDMRARAERAQQHIQRFSGKVMADQFYQLLLTSGAPV